MKCKSFEKIFSNELKKMSSTQDTPQPSSTNRTTQETPTQPSQQETPPQASNESQTQENEPSVETPRKKSARKRKTPESARSAIGEPTTKKLTTTESKILVDAFVYHKGDWRKIISDNQVKQLNRTGKQLVGHIKYRKRAKNSAIASMEMIHERDGILFNISNAAENGADNYEDVVENFTVPSEEEQEEEEPPEVTTPPLAPIHQQLHEHDRAQFDDSVSSTSITSASDYSTTAAQLTDKQKVRNAKIRQKEKEKTATLNHIREQQEQQQQVRTENSDWRQFMVTMMMNQENRYQQERDERRRQQEQEREDRKRQQDQQQWFQNMIMMKMFGISNSEMKPPPMSSSNKSTKQSDNSDDSFEHDTL
jgi:hypothetical protein